MVRVVVRDGFRGKEIENNVAPSCQLEVCLHCCFKTLYVCAQKNGFQKSREQICTQFISTYKAFFLDKQAFGGMKWVRSSIEFVPPLPTPWAWSVKYYLIGFPSALVPTIEGSNLWKMKIKMDHLGKASRKKVAVLLDFVQMRGGGGPCPNFG